ISIEPPPPLRGRVGVGGAATPLAASILAPTSLAMFRRRVEHDALEAVARDIDFLQRPPLFHVERLGRAGERETEPAEMGVPAGQDKGDPGEADALVGEDEAGSGADGAELAADGAGGRVAGVPGEFE